MSDNTSFTNDPTMQGIQPGMIADRYSLAEIEALSRKAARGAGFYWGLAEESGKAVRWLSGYDLPGTDLLAGLLTQNDEKTYESIRPVSADGIWRANDGPLCPIAAGAAISDRGFQIAAGHSIELGQTSFPLLAVFSAGLVSLQHDTPVGVEWAGVSVICTTESVIIFSDEGGLRMPGVERVVISKIDDPGLTDGRICRFAPLSRPVDSTCWQTLEDFAFRTYAPATEQSRAGAGARLIDRD